MAGLCIKCCRSVKHLPTRLICVLIILLQAAGLDYYLVTYKNLNWAGWAAADIVILLLLLITFYFGYRFHRQQKASGGEDEEDIELHTRAGVVTWFVYAAVLCFKVSYAFKDFSHKLDESDFFGPNTLKTTIALAGIVFLILLTTLHDAKPGSSRRKYIDELTGTVIFDILDCVDSMEILFDEEARRSILPSLDDTIIGIACINFLLPTIPLITLSRTNFGHKKLSQKMVILHKVLLAFVVNLPLLITRMVIWHGMSHGISIFSLKNIIVIGIVSYDLYETHESEGDEPTQGSTANNVPSYGMEDRYNYS
ncbi:uncharacterized protein LOC110464397 [Mizuhopecten yessoensis]|uniref:Cat eye syndrome critical region protein 6-like n=1 Tax=Mizuhopecten yessoensis TaxID=6573 RepID=A0A210PU07_MIZYE|nr:uncharacterized protein LOC110464397 [Mizuhopecten yessoensis]OWF39942.1 hypothetical protein KP79_PYT04277 [Mizuhopecten yessoensis]